MRWSEKNPRPRPRPNPRVREAIEARGLTVKGAAAGSGLSRQSWHNVISGRYPVLPRTRKKIAARLGMKVEELFPCTRTSRV